MIQLPSGVHKIVIKKITTTKRELTETFDSDEFSIQAIKQHEKLFNKEFELVEDLCQVYVENETVYLLLIFKSTKMGQDS